MPPTTVEKNAQYTHTYASEPEPDVTIHDDVNRSLFDGPAHEEIAILAYSYWLDEGQQDGSADEHWFRAERELTSRRGAAPAPSGSAGQKASSGTATGTSLAGSAQASRSAVEKPGGVAAEASRK